MYKNNEQPAVSDPKLDKIIDTLLQIDNMDDRPLYFKIKNKIAAKRAKARRRRILLAGSCAALVAVALVSSVWLFKPVTPEDEIAQGESVRLIVSDGRSYSLSDGVSENVVMDGQVVMKAQEGTLFVEASTAAAPTVGEPPYSTLEVPRGMQYDLVLNDGTKVWLNSDTRLRFPEMFTGGTRKVYIEGEAYFEVTHDRSRPFIVETGTHSIIVLGTSFNVSAYEYQPAIHATLMSGSVKVKGTDGTEDSGTVLSPGQQASIDRATGEIGVRQVNTNDFIAWRKNIINLEKRSLDEITGYMAKIYNVSFRFVDESARDIRFRGDVFRSDDIFSVLDRIGEVGGINFTDNGSEIEIRLK